MGYLASVFANNQKQPPTPPPALPQTLPSQTIKLIVHLPRAHTGDRVVHFGQPVASEFYAPVRYFTAYGVKLRLRTSWKG